MTGLRMIILSRHTTRASWSHGLEIAGLRRGREASTGGDPYYTACSSLSSTSCSTLPVGSIEGPILAPVDRIFPPTSNSPPLSRGATEPQSFAEGRPHEIRHRSARVLFARRASAAHILRLAVHHGAAHPGPLLRGHLVEHPAFHLVVGDPVHRPLSSLLLRVPCQNDRVAHAPQRLHLEPV